MAIISRYSCWLAFASALSCGDIVAKSAFFTAKSFLQSLPRLFGQSPPAFVERRHSSYSARLSCLFVVESICRVLFVNEHLLALPDLVFLVPPDLAFLMPPKMPFTLACRAGGKDLRGGSARTRPTVSRLREASRSQNGWLAAPNFAAHFSSAVRCAKVVGDAEGDCDGESVGERDGDTEGDALGLLLGESVGDCEGIIVGLVLGLVLGDTDGLMLGLALGAIVHRVLPTPLFHPA